MSPENRIYASNPLTSGKHEPVSETPFQTSEVVTWSHLFFASPSGTSPLVCAKEAWLVHAWIHHEIFDGIHPPTHGIQWDIIGI